MRMIPDHTGRFSYRPYFDVAELDAECEGAVVAFLERLHGKAEFPIDTDDLTKFLEQEAEDLDLYADLSSEGSDVEGVTYFPSQSRPRVRIAKELSARGREHRLRTTLTHEWGHVHFHRSLWEGRRAERPLFHWARDAAAWRCHRDDIVGAPKVDWMEWQAGYACGAILMPHSRLLAVLAAQASPPPGQSGPSVAELIQYVRQRFNVSTDAARVRLAQLGLTVAAGPPPLAGGE